MQPSGDFLARLRARDPRAFRRLVETEGDKMRKVAFRMTRDPQSAEDVVQEAWIRVVRNIHRFREESLLSTWLHRIVVNSALMHLRGARTRRARTTTSSPALDDVTLALEPASRALDVDLDARRLLRRVAAAIERLPAQNAEALLLAVEDLRTREIARRLASTESATKTRIHRARGALRREFADAR